MVCFFFEKYVTTFNFISCADIFSTKSGLEQFYSALVLKEVHLTYNFPHHFTFAFKTFLILLAVFGIRGVIPRYRFDQVSRLNWKQLILFNSTTLIFLIFVIVLLS